jgi:hypothetical protein
MPDQPPNSLPSIQAPQSSLLSSTIYAIGRYQLDPPSQRARLNRHRARSTDGAPPSATSCIATLPTPAVGAWGLVVMAGIRKPLQTLPITMYTGHVRNTSDTCRNRCNAANGEFVPLPDSCTATITVTCSRARRLRRHSLRVPHTHNVGGMTARAMPLRVSKSAFCRGIL